MCVCVECVLCVCVCFRPDSLFIQIDCNAKYNVHIVYINLYLFIFIGRIQLVVLGVS